MLFRYNFGKQILNQGQLILNKDKTFFSQDEFVQRLKAFMDATRTTGSNLADHAGITKQTFSGYLNKGRTPVCSVIAEWVGELNINSNWLLTGVGEMFLGEGTEAAEQKKDESITDPIAQRMKVAADSLEKAGASPELIQQTFFKILELQNEPHTQAEETLRTPAFANDRDRSIKQP